MFALLNSDLLLNARNQAVIDCVIETPKGSRNKFHYDMETGLFRLKKVLPAGTVFPYDFGFIPGTKGEDGDPLDLLLIMDEPGFPGCVVEARLIGVIEAVQIEEKKKTRNDRLIGVATEAQDNRDLKSLRDLNGGVLKELEHFFVSYNEVQGREFKVLGRHGPRHAFALIREFAQASTGLA